MADDPPTRFPASTPLRPAGRVLGRRAVLGGLVSAPALLALPHGSSAAEERPFRVGVPAASPLPDGARRATEAVLTRATGTNARVHRFAGAAQLVTAAAADELELAVHTALSFAVLHARCGCGAPLLRPVALNGTAGLRATLIARSEELVVPTDLVGATILGGAPGTVAGEVARRAAPAAAGGRLRFGGEAPDVAVSRFAGGSGIAIAGHERIDANGEALGGTMERLTGAHVVWRSEPIWHGPLALSPRVAAHGDAIVGALLSLDPASAALGGLGLGRIRGFMAARAADYAPVIRLLRA